MLTWVIVGAGAIGSYLGGSLALAGQPVMVLARPRQTEALRTTGLRVNGRTCQPGITASLAEALASQPDVLALTVKTFDVSSLARDLYALTATPPPVLCLQNGVDSEAELARYFGAERVLAGTVTTAVSVHGLGEVVIEKARGIGVAANHPLSQPVQAALQAAGIRAHTYANPLAMKWSKLLTNLLGNAQAAILNRPVSDLYANPRLFDVEQRMMREALAVMRALGLPVVNLPGTPVPALAWAFSALPARLARPLLQRGVGQGRGDKMPSLNLAAQAGRPTEVEALNGTVARHGAALGVPTPINTALTALVNQVAADSQQRALYHHADDRLLAELGLG